MTDPTMFPCPGCGRRMNAFFVRGCAGELADAPERAPLQCGACGTILWRVGSTLQAVSDAEIARFPPRILEKVAWSCAAFRRTTANAVLAAAVPPDPTMFN